MTKTIVLWLPALLMMLVIFAFSSMPSSEMPSFHRADLLVKKGGHLLGYAMLAVSYWFALCARQEGRYCQLWVFGMAVVYALSDEFHQSFVPGRNASGWDVLIDASGAALALLVLNRWGLPEWLMRLTGLAQGDNAEPVQDTDNDQR